MNFLKQLASYSDQFDIASQAWIKLIYQCIDAKNMREALAISDQVLDRADQLFRAEIFKDASVRIRTQYEVASVLKALLIIACDSKLSAENITECLKLLDMALLMTGCPTNKDMVFELISDLHSILIKSPLTQYEINVDLHQAPIVKFPVESLASLTLSDFKNCTRPFVYRNYIKHWPAVSSRPWKNLDYLNRLAGHRLVPVEIGSSYTTKGWTQKIIQFHEFLSSLSDSEKIIYLAQFNLLDHIPVLESDISVPDYCYSRDENDPIINIWMGPSGTVSPCHHDPYDNIFAQVVGYKYIRLYHPNDNLYPYPPDQLLSNTSQIDVEFSGDLERYPEFPKDRYFDVLLGPGDVLYIPKGWWHYVRSLTISFSVSFWF